MGKLGALLAGILDVGERREAELREAFLHPDALTDLMFRDCARLMAGIGGYDPPVDLKEREEWIRQQIFCDPVFLAKVKATMNLVREYVEFATHRIPVHGLGKDDQ